MFAIKSKTRHTVRGLYSSIRKAGVNLTNEELEKFTYFELLSILRQATKIRKLEAKLDNKISPIVKN